MAADLRRKIRNHILNACVNNNTEDLKLQLERVPPDATRVLDEVFPEVDNNDSFTFLSTLASLGYDECISILLDAGANVNQQNYAGSTPLHAASINGHKESIRVLVGRGAMQICDREGRTPTDLAQDEHTSLYLIQCLERQANAADEVLDQGSAKREKEEHVTRKVRHFSEILKPLTRRLSGDLSLLYRPSKEESSSPLYVLK